MEKIARKFLLPLLLGSVLIFAIETAQVSASNTTNVDYDVAQTGSFVRLDNDAFWDKFRESVMKDKDKDDAEQSPDDEEQSQNDKEQSQNDVSERIKHT